MSEDTIKDPAIPAMRRLWQAVIMQAVLDITQKAHSALKETEKDQAAAWLNGRNRDFVTVCDLADMNPQFVYEKREALIQKIGTRIYNQTANRPPFKARGKR